VCLAVWTTFFPLIDAIRLRLHDPEYPAAEQLACIVDFGLSMNPSALPYSSRLKDVALGAGSLLHLGLHLLTLATVFLG